MTKEALSLLQLIISALTPIMVLILGWVISKKLEINKLGVLKEKEWQVKWADLFLNKAIEMNSQISILTCSYFKLQSAEKNSDSEKKLIAEINSSIYELIDIEWDIQNFSQFGKKNNTELIRIQKQLFATLDSINKNKKGDFEEIRKLQIEYNHVARKCHNEILNSSVGD